MNSNAQTFALPIAKNFMTFSLLNGSENIYIVYRMPFASKIKPEREGQNKPNPNLHEEKIYSLPINECGLV
jgi:hypothetical protein